LVAVQFTSVGGEANKEDLSTVEFLAYAAREAELWAQYVPVDQIGLTTEGRFAHSESRVIGALIKLYPWEDMLRDEFVRHIAGSQCRFQSASVNPCPGSGPEGGNFKLSPGVGFPLGKVAVRPGRRLFAGADGQGQGDGT
jgi:hypothetical protein